MTTFGSLQDRLKSYPEGMALLQSAGPVSDAFIMSRGASDLLNGPVGSGKTTACIKRALRAAVETPPLLATGVRHYRLALWRETYAQMWGTTIKSWQKVLNPDKGVGEWVGASPRAAKHTIIFEDAFGPIHFEALFMAFGEDADPDDLGGTEYTDAYLNEQDKLREDLYINLARSVGRFPSRGEIGMPDHPGIVHGRIFGDCNAPSPESWVYRDWWSPKKPPGYQLFRQPGGMHRDAENLKAVGRQYYAQQIEKNAHRQWWIKIKIDNEPGFNREMATVYPKYSDARMSSDVELTVFPEVPVIIGVDGGNTPAAAFLQEMADGQLRVLAEVALERGDEFDLARGMRSIIASPRFRDCEFHLTGDPALWAGDDTTNGSFMMRLGKELALKPRRPRLSNNNDTEARHVAPRKAMELTLSADRPGFVVDAIHCPVIRRGLNGTFRFHVDRQSGEVGKIAKTPDSHVCEAMEYAAGETGTSAARQRQSALEAEKKRKRTEARQTGRYSPFTRRTG
jgi:hypothetical protein